MEHTHNWIKRFRRVLIRWAKKVANYPAFFHLAFAYVSMRAAQAPDEGQSLLRFSDRLMDSLGKN